MPYDMKTLTLDVAAATSSTVVFGAIGGQTDSQPIPIPINILGTYIQANFGGALANPTASVGLTAVNGSATSGMRSDGAPALSQAIAPTWTGQHIFNNAITQLGSTSQLQWSTDLILTRNTAATLQLGAADAAAPVAQTVRTQSVVGGTSNTAGAATTFTGSLSTGSGAAGAMNFQISSTGGTSGTTQNAAVSVLQLVSGNNLGSDATNNVVIAPTWNTSGAPTAFKVNPTNTASSGNSILADFQLGGASKVTIREDGLLWWAGMLAFLDQNGSINAVAGTFSSTLGGSTLYASGDAGGVAAKNALSNVNSTTISTGVGSVKMSSVNSANNAVWIKVYASTTAYWVPGWTTNSP